MKHPVRYAYVQPKVFAERARLLGAEKYRELVECETLSCFRSRLLDTTYGDAMTSVSDDQLDIELALHGAYATSLVRIVSGAGRKLISFVESLVLAYEYENVKLVARALISGTSLDEIERYLHVKPEEALDRRHVLARLLTVRNLRDLVEVITHANLIRGESLPVLRYCANVAESTGNTMPLELLLDFEWVAKVARSLRSLGRSEYKIGSYVLSPIVDYRVALSIELCWKEKADKALQAVEQIATCLELDPALLLRDPQRALQTFANKFGLPSADERAVRAEALRRASRAYREYILTVGPLAGLIVFKMNEVSNLIAISRGIDLGLSPHEKMSLIVLPE